MTVEHKLTAIDSLPSLALEYLGDATRWSELADYNSLDYPYIVQDRSQLTAAHSSGYLTIVRGNYSNPVVIKAGWQFHTKPERFTGEAIKLYKVTENTMIPAGVSTYKIPVCCIVPGCFGNTQAFSITQVEAATAAASNIQFVAVYNEEPFINGQDLNVKSIGDLLYIPTEYSEVVPEDISRMVRVVCGEDLLLDSDGDLVIEPGGDLASVYGVENVRYAVKHRLASELEELLLHPEYGIGLDNIIGAPNLVNKEKLIEITVCNTLVQEDRIKDVVVHRVATNRTSVYLDLSYKITVSDTEDRLKVTIRGGATNVI